MTRKSSLPYKRWAPEGTFLRMWMDSLAEQETPYEYDFWTGLWLLGNAIGRGCPVERPRAPVFCNWYIVLVAESGTTRKSTAVRQATKTLRAFNERVGGHIGVIDNKITPEALDLYLHRRSEEHDQAHCAITISELVTFLGREKYVMAMPGLLTDLYDSADIRRGGGTLSRGETHARNVYVSLLSASTPSWLLKSINPDVIEGGFTSRVMFVVAEKRKKSIPWPEGDVDHEGTTERLGASLQRIRSLAGKYGGITVSVAARQRFARWYNSRVESHDAYRRSFESREDAHILRVAACLAANDERFDIQRRDIDRAILAVGAVKDAGGTIFTLHSSGDRLIAKVDRLRTLILDAGDTGISGTRLAVTTQRQMTKDERETILYTLRELGAVHHYKIKQTRGRPTDLWKATPRIGRPDLMNEVLERFEPTL